VNILEIEEIEEKQARIQQRLTVATRKISIFEKKLEECKKNNAPLPPSVCDTKPLDEAKKERDACRVALAELSITKECKSWKQGDIITVYSDQYHRMNRDTGFQSLDQQIALEKARHNHWCQKEMYVAQIEVVERKPNGRVLARNCDKPKVQYLGVPVTETYVRRQQ
jgi:hypothetical protein